MAACHGNLQEEASASGADLYAVLGLNRECTDAELRGAYRRLAMIWHPDRCTASGSSSTRVEEAKERFQEIQGAYSVLSDSNKRFLYDVGVYDSEEDEADLSGMGDFLGEMADMMSQATPTETFQDLQQLFVDMFQDDLDPVFFTGLPPGRRAQQAQSPPSTSFPRPSSTAPLRPPAGTGRSSAQAPPTTRNGVDNKRGSPAAHSAAKRPRPGWAGLDLESDLGLSGFCFLVSETKQRQQAPWTCDYEVGGGAGGERRSGRKQRLSTSRDVSGDGTRLSRQSQGSSGAWWQ
ncbi:hypothetical protein BAE44_0023166 [Dichanthelium oligosanthes]|uniref:J domain-containing protein n=1 Tax=Dichanthelium oligosanthes TaxID=888268 RepID=A0A1E5USL6_9POAL|nr:hypothetical protein BAE44_0023166 [Dichanthelium oligosanthes]